MKLISMTDFVIQQSKIKQSSSEFIECVKNYADFLKQPLELWMFVPCDENNNVMLIPGSAPIYTHPKEYILEYQQAKERCLFDNEIIINKKPYKSTQRILIDIKGPTHANIRLYNELTYHNGEVEKRFLPHFYKIPNIEYLVDYQLTLTQTAIKQLGL